MKRILDVQSMRASDAAAISGGIPGRELMGRAGEGIFRAAAWKPPVAIVCGKGNNAGDGYVLGVRLADSGIPCTLFLPEMSFSPDGEDWYRQCKAAGIPVRLWEETESLEGFGSVADCIFGTGFRGRVTGEAERMIDLINGSGAYVVSADINSGLNGDNGLAEKAVVSDLTVSVGHFQPGHFLNQAMDLMKNRVNCEIGIDPMGPERYLMETEDAASLFPPRKHFVNKGTYGYVGIIGGSQRYAGAVRLACAANAAMRSGAGVVKAAIPRSLCPALMPLILESTVFPLSDQEGTISFRREEWQELIRGLRVIAAGMGMGNGRDTREAVAFLLKEYAGTLILDAAGVKARAELMGKEPKLLAEASCRVLLTPHPGEFSRLTGRSIREIQESGCAMAEEYAEKQGVTLLLKGPATVVTDGKVTYLTDRGCPGMATAGSGDVLSGILAAVCAGDAPLPKAAAVGAWLNGRAGEIAQTRMGDVSMIAGDTVAAIPEALRELREKYEIQGKC